MFERVVETCIAAGLVGGEGFAVDASLIAADANKQQHTEMKNGGPNAATGKGQSDFRTTSRLVRFFGRRLS